MIEVRRATLADKPAISEFLPRAYGEKARYKFPERWEWQFEKNPFRKADELPIWIAVNENGAVVGQECAMIEPLKIGTETYRLSWSLDTFLLPECRGQKIGFKLFEAGFASSDIFMGLRMTETSRYNLTKLGCVPTEPVTVFSRVVRFDTLSTLAALRHRLNNKWPGRVLLWLLHFFWLDRLITALVNLSVGICDLGLSRQVNAGIAIRQIDKFDYAADEFWDSVSPQFHAIVQRNSRYLNWKYVQQPHMNYQLFAASRRGKMCGYVILRKARPPESNTGIIADLFVPLDDKVTIHSLLAFAVQHFKHQKVKYISAASSVDAYGSALSTLGFRKKRDWIPMFHSRIKTPAVESTLIAGSWLLGRSDCDSDQFPDE